MLDPKTIRERARLAQWELSDAWEKTEDTANYKMLLLVAAAKEKHKETQEKIRLWRNFENAEGKALDMFGQWLAMPRNGMTDTEYVAMMKILRNIDTVSSTFQAVFDALEYIYNVPKAYTTIDEVYPAKVRIKIEIPGLDIPLRPTVTMRLIDDVLAGGVGFELGVYISGETKADVYVGATAQNHMHFVVEA